MLLIIFIAIFTNFTWSQVGLQYYPDMPGTQDFGNIASFGNDNDNPIPSLREAMLSEDGMDDDPRFFYHLGANSIPITTGQQCSNNNLNPTKKKVPKKKKWKIIAIVDQTFLHLLNDKVYNPHIYNDHTVTSGEYYGYLKKYTQGLSIEEDKDLRLEWLNKILFTGFQEEVYGWNPETGRYEDYIKNIPGYLDALDIDSSNPENFEELIYAFASLLDEKPYDSIKGNDDTTASYSAVDALTSHRGGVCTDYAVWIIELMAMSGMPGIDLDKLYDEVNLDNAASSNYATGNAGHSMGKILNPLTNKYYYVNYGKVLSYKDGSLIPQEELITLLASDHNGLTIRKGKYEVDDEGNLKTRQNEASGIALTPTGKAIQDDVIFGNLNAQDDSFDKLKIEPTTGVASNRTSTTALRFQKLNDVENLTKTFKGDIGVSYLYQDKPKIAGVENEFSKYQRIIVWA